MESRSYCCPPVPSECAALMQKLSEASFFKFDLQLYLDTHPDDKRALEMFKEACRQADRCEEAFESHCYPLTACSSGSDCEWDWFCGAWPSDKL